ncbi:MAG: hypothetical protein RIE31_05290 [Alphaproteobacteria bacterium]
MAGFAAAALAGFRALAGFAAFAALAPTVFAELLAGVALAVRRTTAVAAAAARRGAVLPLTGVPLTGGFLTGGFLTAGWVATAAFRPAGRPAGFAAATAFTLATGFALAVEPVREVAFAVADALTDRDGEVPARVLVVAALPACVLPAIVTPSG